MPTALTRPVSPGIADCELTHLERVSIDYETARRQHAEYEACLEHLGCRVVRLPLAADLPDSVFIEDTALVLDQVAVITHPGAASRRPETPAVADALRAYRPLLYIEPPATLDGGDVLRLGKTIFVGLSGRSNPESLAQLSRLLDPFGYHVQGIPLTGCLHLKSAVTQVAHDTLLLNPSWVDAALFAGWRIIEVDPSEPFGANALLLGGSVIYPAAYTATAARLALAGVSVCQVDASELAKAEGGVTCCSLIFEV